MDKRLGAILGLVLLAAVPVRAENYTVRGGMGAEIRYELRETITAGDDVHRTTLSFVMPRSFESPTFRQEIQNADVSFSPRPDERTTREDGRGNRILTAIWNSPPGLIDVRLAVTAVNTTGLDTIETKAPFPL